MPRRCRCFSRARRGIAVVPENRGVFASLSVLENLRLAARAGAWDEERVLALFPRLRERSRNRGNQLSGGEQQMLAIGRALMTNPRVLILDEATEGLAPLMRDEIWHTIRVVRDSGIAVVVVDKTVSAVLSLADRVTVLVKGGVVYSGTPQVLREDAELMHRHLGIDKYLSGTPADPRHAGRRPGIHVVGKTGTTRRGWRAFARHDGIVQPCHS